MSLRQKINQRPANTDRMAHRYNLRSAKENSPTDEVEERSSADESDADLTKGSKQVNSSIFLETSNSDDEFTTAKKSQYVSGCGQQANKYPKIYPSLPHTGSSPLSKRHTKKKSPMTSVSEDSSRDQSQEGTRTKNWLGFAMAICLLAGLVYLCRKLLDGENGFWMEKKDFLNLGKSELTSRKFSVFCEQTDLMASEFPVHPQLWKVVKASVKHVLESERPTYPGILLLATDKRNAAVAAHIAETVAVNFEAAAMSEQPQKCLFDLSEMSGLEAEEQKYKLDEWLQEQLKGRVGAVVIDHLEVLAPEAALLLHGYCDGDNAPFKSALLIFVLCLEEISPSPRSVENSFHKILVTKLPEDKARALLSRVANNIGVVLVQ